MKQTLEDEIAASNATITPDVLKKAIRCKFDKDGMEDAAALEMAWHVLDFFGYSERLLDNILDIDDRGVFYMLEDAGLLTTEREETNLYDGKEWRIHYWVLKNMKIFELAAEHDRVNEIKPDKSSQIYSELPDEVFARQKA